MAGAAKHVLGGYLGGSGVAPGLLWSCSLGLLPGAAFGLLWCAEVQNEAKTDP